MTRRSKPFTEVEADDLRMRYMQIISPTSEGATIASGPAESHNLPRSLGPQAAPFGARSDGSFVENLDWKLASSTALSRFLDWEAKDTHGIFLVTGLPGCGKSMLLEAIARGLEQKTARPSFGVAYFFCNRNTRDTDWENPTTVVASLVGQLVRQQPYLLEHLIQAHGSVDDKEFNQERQFHTMATALYSMIQDPQFIPTLFLVNAIDQCCPNMDLTEVRDDEDLLDLLYLISITSSSQKVRWVVSGTDSLQADKEELNTILHLNLDVDTAMQPVADAYSDHMANILMRDIIRGNEDFRHDIERILCTKSQGNFLWIRLACKIVQSMRAPSSAFYIIEKLPSSVKNLLSYAMDRIPKYHPGFNEDCHNILCTVATAYRPLSTKELEEIIGPRLMVKSEFIIRNYCVPFLEVHDGRILLSHQCVKDFLYYKASHFSDTGYFDRRIIRGCQGRLSALARKTKRPTAFSMSQDEEDLSLAIHYAALYWSSHLSRLRPGQIDKVDEVGFLSDSDNVIQWLDLLTSSTDLMRALVQMEKLEWTNKPSWDQLYDSCFLAGVRYAFDSIYCRLFAESPGEIHPKNSLLFMPDSSDPGLLKYKPKWLKLLPIGRQRRPGITFRNNGHTNYVQSCAYSFDGRWLASGSDDKTVRIYNRFGQIRNEITKFNDGVRVVQFSSEGHLVTVEHNYVKIWKPVIATLEKTITESDLGSSSSSFTSAAFSRDARKLAISRGNQVGIWYVSSYVLSKEWETEHEITCLKFSNNGRLALASFGLGGSSGSLAIFSPDDGTKLYEMRAEEPLNINDICYSPDSRLISAALDSGNVMVWKADRDDSAPRSFANHKKSARSVSFSPDSVHLASAFDDTTVRVYDLSNPADDQKAQIFCGHEREVMCVSWSPVGPFLASSSADKTVRTWYWDTDAMNSSSPGHKQPITIVKFSQDEKLLASGSIDGQVCLWDGDTGHHLRSLEGHDGQILWLFFSRDGQRLGSTSEDSSVIIWNTSTGMQMYKLQHDYEWVRCATYSNNQELLASASDDCIVRLWDLSEDIHNRLRKLEGSSSESDRDWEQPKETNIDDNDDWSIVSGPGTGKGSPRQFRGHSGRVHTIAFSTDDKYLVSGGYDRTIRMWCLIHQGLSNEESNKQSAAYRIFNLDDPVSAVAVSLNGQHLVSSSSSSIQIWDIESGTCLRESKGGPFTSLQLNSDNLDWVLTEKGPLCLKPTKDDAELWPSSWPPWSLQSDWIRWKDKKALYIPRHHQPTGNGILTSRVQGHSVAIGCGSGEVHLLVFVKGAEFGWGNNHDFKEV
ncbi:WD40-repeat-containing domain protein [Nemania sp. FL0031]|nr:WD40-repeat-containing domain protein [Nemania sp. FL0031]